MKYLLSFILQMIAGIVVVNAQRICTSEISLPSTIGSNHALSSVAEGARDTLNNELITIPVVVHILYKDGIQNISTAQVLSQIEALNKDFSRKNTDAVYTPEVFAGLAADVKIQFCLAKVDPLGRPTNGIIRKYTNTANFLADDEMKFSSAGGDNAWDSKRYLNIWVCKLFGRSLGYSSLPGGPADRDGVVIAYDVFGTTGTVRPPYDKGRTATHEIGHWLGLKHLWGDANCGSDDIADTPPQQSYSTGCPSFPHMSSCSINANGDMFMNFMDFSDDGCMNMFTVGQKSKMRSLFAIGGARNTFLLSKACDSSQAEDGPLPEVIVPAISISVYPNPSANEIYITVSQANPVIKTSYRLFNSTGIQLMDGSLQSQKTMVNISRLSKGIYFIRIGEGEDSVTKKILKL